MLSDTLKRKKMMLAAAVVAVAAIGMMAYYGGSAVFASHSFEAGVRGDTVPDNTHVRLDGLTLAPGAVLPLYDASPNFVSSHFLMRAPCDPETHVPHVTVIAGHVDESEHGTYVDKVPLYYISHASSAGSCVYHAHLPDPLNGGAPQVTDIALVNLSGNATSFNGGDVVDVNIHRVLGSMAQSPYGEMKLPSDLSHGNPVFDLNDDNPDNDGLGFVHPEEGE